jgi:hypothetical protein
MLFFGGMFLAGAFCQRQIADETVSGSALFWAGDFTKVTKKGRVGRQTIDREE